MFELIEYWMGSSIFLLLIGVIFSLFFFKKTHPKSLKWILIGLVLSVVIPFLSISYFSTIAYFSFGILSLMFTIYSYKNKKYLGMIISLFVVISFLFATLNFPFLNELRLMMIIPTLSFVFIFKWLNIYKGELSILVIFVAYELGEFLQLFLE